VKIIVATGPGELVEALDGAGQHRRVEVDGPREAGHAPRLAQPPAIQPAEQHDGRILPGELRVEDPPSRQMDGQAGRRIAFVDRYAEIGPAFIEEAPAVRFTGMQ
jgi:hypothetical protein